MCSVSSKIIFNHFVQLKSNHSAHGTIILATLSTECMCFLHHRAKEIWFIKNLKIYGVVSVFLFCTVLLAIVATLLILDV